MKKNKSKHLRRLKKLLAVLAVAIAGIVITVAAVNSVLYKLNMSYAQSFEQVRYEAQLAPQTDANGCAYFVSDDDFNIMQLTDIHIGGGFLSFKKDRMAMNAVAAMISEEKPDLVIITGDMTYATPQAASFNNKLGVKLLASLMERLGVYWTVTFGNHDSEVYSYYSREKVSGFYTDPEYTHCLYEPGPEEVDGFGNHIINVKNSDGLITQSLIMLDSHAYTDDDPLGVRWLYENIHENQVDWYRANVEELTAQNAARLSELGLEATGESVSSLLFFHIPLVEYLDAYTEYSENSFKDTADVKYIRGVIGESGKFVYCGAGEDNLFESLDGTKAVFCGHDHLNNIQLEYKGVRLCYGMSSDYLAYIGISKKGDQRGCTMIASYADSSIGVMPHSYYDDKYTPLYEKEEVTMISGEGGNDNG